jgi:small-conductance mechanosensitive channel
MIQTTRNLLVPKRLMRRLPAILHRAAALLACAMMAMMLAGGAQAQAPVDPASPRGKLEQARNVIGSVEAALRGREPAEAELQRLRQSLEPLRDQLRIVVDEALPVFEQAKSQLEQLGPKPDKGATESEDVAKERAQREKAVSEQDELVKLGRTLSLRVDQLATEIADRRRAFLTKQLFSRSQSLLSPDLWITAVKAFPGDIAAMRQLGQEWLEVMVANAGSGRSVALLGALAAAALLFWGRARLLPGLQARIDSFAGNSQFGLVLGAILKVIAGTLPAALGCILIFNGATHAGFVPPRFEPVREALLSGIVFWIFIQSLTGALLAPEAAERRFFGVADRNARILSRMVQRAALVVVTAKLIESLLQASAAALSTSIIVRGLFSIAFGLAIARGLYKLRDTEEDDENCLGPHVPVDGARVAPFRILGWIAVAGILISALAGYISLGTFLTDQSVWLFIIAVTATVALFLIDGLTQEVLKPQSRISRALQLNIGLRQRAVEQIGVVSGGVAKLIVLAIAAMLALAPWGVESGDLFSSLKAVFFGFKVGDITLSLASLIVAAAFLAAGLAATRAFQRWLDNRLLPVTDIDAGLRNSIKTGAGYIGFAAAGALSISALGLSLDKLTIVAGALSLGIGFGLQSIVSNFVSGLILLWERPIRVGDLIVAGEGDGVVKRINVRSTEIETADRSMVIIPNSNLISGVVKNRVRADRTGRVVIALSVPRDTDPSHVRDVLIGAAKDHGDVLAEPPPRVFFKKISETTLDFELICVVGEIDLGLRVTSDLHFVIHKRLNDEHIGAPGREVSIKGLDRIEDTLEEIAEAIEDQRQEPPARSASAPAVSPASPPAAPRKARADAGKAN